VPDDEKQYHWHHIVSEPAMIRTINEHYRTAKFLREKAESAPRERRERLLQLARFNLMFANSCAIRRCVQGRDLVLTDAAR
jgi:hypothetical protein